MCSWPLPTYMKFNTDGSLAADAKVGVIARNHFGHPLWATAKRMLKTSIGLIEMDAIQYAMELAILYGMQQVWFESDSLVAVQTIKGEYTQHWMARNCILKIEDHTNQFQDWKISHCWGERAADFVAISVVIFCFCILRSFQSISTGLLSMIWRVDCILGCNVVLYVLLIMNW